MNNHHPDEAARLRAAAALVVIHLDCQTEEEARSRKPGLVAAISALRGSLAAHQARLSHDYARAGNGPGLRDPSRQYAPGIDARKIDALAGDLQLAEEIGHG